MLEKIRKRKPTSEKTYEGERALVLSSRLKPRNLIGADFRNADLRSVDLTFAKLQGALLDGANLHSASLNFASLQGASLIDANLQRASLGVANLQGASLDYVRLHGASLINSNLQGASLNSAYMQGVSLDYVRLQGASLINAKLQSASLIQANLQGASLNSAYMQGASLFGSNLQGALLRNTQLWRTRNIFQITGAYLSNPDLEPINNYDKLIRNALDGVINEQTQEKIKISFAVLKPDARTPEQDMKQVYFWAGQEILSLSKYKYQTQLAKYLIELACDFEHRPYIAQGLTHSSDNAASRIAYTGPNALFLARLLLNATPTTCPGAVDIHAEARTKLQKIIAGFESDENPEPVSSIDPAAFDRHREIQ